MEEAMKTASNVRWSGAMVGLMNHVRKNGNPVVPRFWNRTARHLERLALLKLEAIGGGKTLYASMTDEGREFMEECDAKRWCERMLAKQMLPPGTSLL
jgi:hypothetical protein